MVMRRFCYLLLCLFVWQLNFAADLKETFDVKLQNGLKMRIEVCEEGIFRIQVTPHENESAYHAKLYLHLMSQSIA